MNKKALGLEIDSSKIRVVELERTGMAICLKKMASVPTPAGTLRGGEIIDADKMANAIRGLLNTAEITTKGVVISLLGKGVIVQEITLPSMPTAEMREVIKSELENYPILSNDDFIFDYQPLSEFTKEGYKKVRVFFVGISSSLLSSYFRCMQKAGLSVAALDIAPLSMATSQYLDLSEDKATASVLIKYDKTYVTVARKGRLCLFYSIDIGSGQLLESKAHPEDDPERTALSRLISELERSFKFYEVEFKAEKIDRVLLSYDRSQHPDLDKRIISELGKEIKVEIANPFKQIKLPNQTDTDKMAEIGPELFTVAIGAALKGLKRVGHNLSLELLQKYIPRPKELRKRSVVVLITCILVILITAGISGYQGSLCGRFNLSLVDKEAQLASLDTRLTRLKELAARHKDLRERLKRQAAYLERLNRVSWSALLSKVAQRIPEDVWLKIFDYKEKGKLSLEGGTFTVDKVADFIRELDQEPAIEDIDLNLIKQKKFTKTVEGLDFKLEGTLSKEKEKKDE